MDSDGEHGSGLNGCYASCCKFVLGLFTNVDVSCNFGATAAVDDVLSDFIVTDDGGILLARGDGSAITGDLGVDYDVVRV